MKTNCDCHAAVGRNAIANLMQGEAKRHKWENKEVLIVPVIMARSDVPMNNALVPVEEFLPQTWNGVPVTLAHPNANGEFLSANTPENITNWSVGRIFNAKVVSGQLRAEAWIEVERANELAPGLIDQLESGIDMDVSTGYFCDEVDEAGARGGKTYEKVHRALRPDHLALLPNEAGACSWVDGCGVRANKGSSMKEKLSAFVQSIKTNLSAVVTAAEQLEENVVTKKVANADELKKLGYTDDQVKAMVNAATADPASNADAANAFPPKDEPDEDDPQPDKKAASKKGNAAAIAQLSGHDRAALAYANKVYAAARDKAIATIVGNSKFTADDLKTFTADQLEAMAEKLKVEEKPAANFAGRALPTVNSGEADKVKVEPMGVVHSIRERNKAKGAA